MMQGVVLPGRSPRNEVKARVEAGELASSPCLGSSSPCSLGAEGPMKHLNAAITRSEVSGSQTDPKSL